jgi:hypothetical protein
MIRQHRLIRTVSQTPTLACLFAPAVRRLDAVNTFERECPAITPLGPRVICVVFVSVIEPPVLGRERGIAYCPPAYDILVGGRRS